MANGKKKDYRKDPLGKAAQAYGVARRAIRGKGGRSVASEAMAYLYRLAKGAKPKKKNPPMKWSPKGGRGMKKGGRVRRKR